MTYDIQLAYRGKLNHSPVLPVEPAEGDRKLGIVVLFTGIANTLRALKTAARMVEGLDARVRLLVPQMVPYPLPLASPPVLLEFAERRFRLLAEQQKIETQVEIFLCRDSEILWSDVLPGHSTVIIGGARRWWPTKEENLARSLRRAGHEVIFATDAFAEEKYVHA